jgi:hypothetical protein
MRQIKKIIPLLLALVLAASLLLPAAAADTLRGAVEETAAYLVGAVPAPQFGSAGGEWAVLGLARGGCAVPDGYYDAYYAGLEDDVKACGGVLHEKKYTEYSRVGLALTAIGRNPADVAGYDLLRPLADFDKVVWQGPNGAIWALLAWTPALMRPGRAGRSHAGDPPYVRRFDPAQSARGRRMEHARERERRRRGPDGHGAAGAREISGRGGGRGRDGAGAGASLRRADAAGGFASEGTANAESTAQVLVALCELGVRWMIRAL